MAWREGNDGVTVVNQTLQFRGKVNGLRTLGVSSHVHGGDTNRVSSSNGSVLLGIVKGPGKHTVQVLWSINIVLLIKWDDWLTVTGSLEWVVWEVFSQLDVVVDLTIDTKGQVTSLIGQWLGTSGQTNNGQSFVDQDGVVSDEVTTPIRTSVSDSLGQLQSLGLE